MLIKPIHLKLAAAGGIVLFVAVVVGIAIWLLCMGDEQREAQAAVAKVVAGESKPEEVIQLMTTVSFEKLPKKQYDQLAAKMRDMRNSGQRPPMTQGQLTDQQRQQMRKNMRFMMHRMMQARVDEFSKLTTDEQRNAYLDKQIDEMGKHRMGPPPGGGRPRGNNDGKNNNRPKRSPGEFQARHKVRMDTSSTVERAQFSNYMHALHNRMKERGIQRRGRR